MKKNNAFVIFKGSIFAFVLSVVLLLVLSLVLVYTNLNESFSKYIILAIMSLSIIIGSFISSRKLNKNGLINGGMVGFIYIISIYLLSSIIIGDFSFNLYSVIAFIVSILTGVIGGVIGVNL